MSLSSIKKNAEVTGSLLDAGPVTPVRIESIDGDKITAGLLIDSPLGQAGTKFNLFQPQSVRGINIADIARGRPERPDSKPIPASAIGDVVVFEHGVVDGANLVVGKVAIRMHDGFQGPIQAGRVFARPGRASVSKRGAIQFCTIADPGKAFVTADAAAFREAARRELGAAWPGGRIGFILRDKVNCHEILADQDDKWSEPLDEFLDRLLVTNGILDSGPVEAIPLWSIQMGREQVCRDVNPREMTTKPVTGPFASLYSRNFLPSIALLTEEDEWAFGGKTGRTIRVVGALHPLRTDLELKPDTLPTQARNHGVLPTPMRFLYRSEADIQAAHQSRATRQATAAQAPSAAPAADFMPRPVMRRGGGRG